MPESYFSSPGWRGFLYLIGVYETGGSECLKGDAEQQDLLITLFEEYANQGLHLCRHQPGVIGATTKGKKAGSIPASFPFSGNAGQDIPPQREQQEMALPGQEFAAATRQFLS